MISEKGKGSRIQGKMIYHEQDIQTIGHNNLFNRVDHNHVLNKIKHKLPNLI